MGSRRGAILFSLGANATHGLRRTNEDKRRAVKFMLDDPDWSIWSNRQIAKACGVSPGLVDKIRPGVTASVSAYDRQIAPDAELAAEPEPTVRKAERNGTVYEQKVDNIGRSQPTKPAADPEADLDARIAQTEAAMGVALTEVEQLQAEQPSALRANIVGNLFGSRRVSRPDRTQDDALADLRSILERDAAARGVHGAA